MSDSIRPITIPSVYQKIECGGCGASIIVDTSLPALADDPEWCDVDNHGDDCETVARFQKVIDESKPADVKLTRLQAKALHDVKRNPGTTAPDVASRLGHRPRSILDILETLERFRWLESDRSATGAYSWTWRAKSPCRCRTCVRG